MVDLGLLGTLGSACGVQQGRLKDPSSCPLPLFLPPPRPGGGGYIAQGTDELASAHQLHFTGKETSKRGSETEIGMSKVTWPDGG